MGPKTNEGTAGSRTRASLTPAQALAQVRGAGRPRNRRAGHFGGARGPLRSKRALDRQVAPLTTTSLNSADCARLNVSIALGRRLSQAIGRKPAASYAGQAGDAV